MIPLLMFDPMLVYQYMPSNAIDALIEKRIITSSPDSMNDPFEWRPCVSDNPSRNVLRDHYRAKNPGSAEPSGEMLERFLQDFRKVAQDYQDRFQKDSAAQYRLLCFSGSDVNIRHVLMWAHYADRHCGFVVCFKTDELRRNAPNSELIEVTYDSPPSIVPHPYQDPPSKEQLRAVFSHKSKEWGYEKEWRLIVPIEYLDVGNTGQGPRLFLRIPGAALHMVVFGMRCAEELKLKIRSICARDPELKHVKFVQADPSRENFAIHTYDCGASGFSPITTETGG